MPAHRRPHHKGQEEYRLLLENDLIFTVAMTSNGHAEISGTFREVPHQESDSHQLLFSEVSPDEKLPLQEGRTFNERTSAGVEDLRT